MLQKSNKKHTGYEAENKKNPPFFFRWEIRIGLFTNYGLRNQVFLKKSRVLFYFAFESRLFDFM